VRLFALVLFYQDLQLFPFSLKEKVLTFRVLIFKVEGTFMCLFSSLGICNLLSSLLKEKVLILKAFL